MIGQEDVKSNNIKIQTTKWLYKMNKKTKITPLSTVKELIDKYPEVLPIFFKIGLFCAGCPAESFHTLEDVARENNLNLEQLLQRLQGAIQNGC